MRYVLDVCRNRAPTDTECAMVFESMFSMTDAARGVGVNFLLPRKDMDRLGVA